MLSVLKNGNEYVIDDGTIAWYIGDDGFGMSPQHRITERGPLQHGATDRGFRLDPRVAQLVLEIPGTSRPDLFERRSQLLDVFFTQDTPASLRWSLDGFTKQIDFYYADDMSFPSDERNSFEQRMVITLFCPNPTFYDPSAVATGISVSGAGAEQFQVPFNVPWGMQRSVLDNSVSVEYSGSFRSFPHLIRIVGPITDAIITNESTGEKLDFTGTTISDGDYYELDLTYGNKTVFDSSGNKKVADLTDDSDLGTFHIADSGEVAGGTNIISITGNTITDTTQVFITFYERYIGL